MHSNDKAVVKATLLEVNSKIKSGEECSCMKPLLICRYPLMGKNLREVTLK